MVWARPSEANRPTSGCASHAHAPDPDREGAVGLDTADKVGRTALWWAARLLGFLVYGHNFLGSLWQRLPLGLYRKRE
jgi:hypothetical protein